MPIVHDWSSLQQVLERPDGRKCAIVVQGGAMRAIYSMAALFGLEELGYGQSFQQAYGSSAGGINLAYMLAGQAKDGTEVFLNHISNWRFVSFWRLWKLVDIDFMVDDVVRHTKKLNLDRVRNSKTELHVYCTDTQTGHAADFTNRRADVDFLEVIRATAAMPYLYHRKVPLPGGTYVDGGVAEYLPLQRAIADGCTDIVVIATKQAGGRRRGLGPALSFGARLLAGGFSSEFMTRMLSEDRNYNQACDIIEGIEEVSCNVYPLFPSNLRKLVSRTTTDRGKLIECAMMARNDVRAKFGVAASQVDPFSPRP